MTTNTDTLPAGEELDERVATEVMSLVWMASPGQENGHDCIVHADDANALSKRGYRQRRSDSTAPRIAPPPFSGTMAAAWDVVEHLIRRGWTYHLGMKGGEPRQHGIAFSRGGPYQAFARADTAPHAICLAALEAAALEREP